jgi:hypothetical protein
VGPASNSPASFSMASRTPRTTSRVVTTVIVFSAGWWATSIRRASPVSGRLTFPPVIGSVRSSSIMWRRRTSTTGMMALATSVVFEGHGVSSIPSLAIHASRFTRSLSTLKIRLVGVTSNGLAPRLRRLTVISSRCCSVLFRCLRVITAS